MSNKKPEESETEEKLKEAFALVDQLSGRLDALKASFNRGAKEIQSLRPGQVEVPGRTLPPPPPVVTLAPPAPVPPPLPTSKPPESGRYSIATPGTEERVDLPKARLPIPRPRPKTEPTISTVTIAERDRTVPIEEPKRRSSGRFYLEVRLDGTKDLPTLRDKLAQVGRIVDSGEGTAETPTRAWVEVASHDDISSLIHKLREIHVREQVEKVIEVLPGEGRLQARQLDLFSKVNPVK